MRKRLARTALEVIFGEAVEALWRYCPWLSAFQYRRGNVAMSVEVGKRSLACPAAGGLRGPLLRDCERLGSVKKPLGVFVGGAP